MSGGPGQASRPTATRRPARPRQRGATSGADIVIALGFDDVQPLAATVLPDDWPRITTVWDRFTSRYPVFRLRTDTGLDRGTFLVIALGQARQHGLLRRLGKELMREGLVSDEFETRLAAAVGGSAFELQTFHGGVFRPFDAHLSARNALLACDQVCRIDIDEVQKGTGVQVSQTLVATAAHVVWPLVTPRPDGSLRAADRSVGRLTLTFGDYVDYVAEDDMRTERCKGENASPHPNWLAWISQPTDKERTEKLADVDDIAGISSDDGPWDLALIRLAEPRLKVRPARLLDRDPPANPFAINILHHPHGGADRGEPLLCSIGELDYQLGDPPVRFLHNADTLQGSSGAPVFDGLWRVVALHQGGERVLHSADDAKDLAQDSRNRAVPVRPWSDRLDDIARFMRDDVPYVRELKTSRDLTPYPYPVIGRRETQRRLWRAMQPDATAAQRLLIIHGEPSMGLRFTKRLVREFVTAAAGGGLVVTLTMANALNEDAAGFAERITGTLSAQLPQLDPQPTTLQRNIRTGVAPGLCGRLEELANGQPTWLVLDGFYEPGADCPIGVKDLIAGLATGLGEYRTLRLVLVGWSETPAGYEESVEGLLPPTAQDIADYLTPAGETPDPQRIMDAQSDLDYAAEFGITGYPAALSVLKKLARKYSEVHSAGGNG